MKLPTNDICTESAELLGEQSFGIGNIGLIFEILRNRMYKNPILAIAREITCNARDAHREIGKVEVPIEIHFPSIWEPQYRVRDFGPGISPDRMSNVFIQYATSTKRQDNLQTGGFGLGAKTPFSYTDTFSIETVVDKIKRIYTAYIDESRVGKMALTSEQPTTESNGTTIVIPVARADFAEFVSCTMRATEFWDVKPILKGIVPLPSYFLHEALFSGRGWELIQYFSQYASYSKQQGSLAIVDGIPYQIEAANFPSLSASQRLFLNNPFLFHFGIGEISLAASRDSIYYDEKTLAAISATIQTAENEIVNCLKKKIEACQSYREASLLYAKIESELRLDDLVQSVRFWQGHKLQLRHPLSDVGRYAKLTEYHSFGTHAPRQGSSISIANDTKIFYNDKTQETISKSIPVELFKLYPDIKHIQIVSAPRVPTCWRYKSDVRAGQNPSVSYDLAFLDLIGAEKLSSIPLPKIQKVVAPRLQKKEQTVLAYKFTSLESKIDYNVVQLPDTGGVYVEVNYHKDLCSSGDLILNNCKQLKVFNELLQTEIVGFTAVRMKKLSPHWIPLHVALAKKLQQIEQEIPLDQLKDNAINSNWISKFRFHHLVSHKEFNIQVARIKSPTSLFLQYLNASKEVDQSVLKYSLVFKILHANDELSSTYPITDRYNAIEDVEDSGSTLYQMYQEVSNRYPLLPAVSHHGIDSRELAGVIDYINWIDQKFEQQTNSIS